MQPSTYQRRPRAIPEAPTPALILNVHPPASKPRLFLRSKGDVKSEPAATLKADRRVLEWVLPSTMRPGGKQVTQARLSVDEGQVRTVAIPQTAPAVVRCLLVDSTFSSVELETAALAEEGGQDVPGKVVKRCRVQCKQQG